MFRKPSAFLFAPALLWLVLLQGAPARALDVPPLEGRVNDQAGILSPATEQRLERALRELEQSDSTQIAVLTLPSLQGDSLEDFSIRVAEQWKIGHKGKDNGVIFLVSEKDRKVRIEVGYGLEGVLTDAKSSRIIRNEVVPYFRQGDYDRGIHAGLRSILGVIGGEGQPEAAGARVPVRAKSTASGLLMLLILFFLLFSRSGRFFLLGGMLGGMWGGRGMSRGGMGGFGGGGFGGGGGGFGGGGASGGWRWISRCPCSAWLARRPAWKGCRCTASAPTWPSSTVSARPRSTTPCACSAPWE